MTTSDIPIFSMLSSCMRWHRQRSLAENAAEPPHRRIFVAEPTPRHAALCAKWINSGRREERVLTIRNFTLLAAMGAVHVFTGCTATTMPVAGPESWDIRAQGSDC